MSTDTGSQMNGNENPESNDIFEEDETDPEKMKIELETIVKSLPSSLIVALIKICQLNNYEPLPFETYYNGISPSFHLLRRKDGGKYTKLSTMSIRGAMFSNRIFTKTENGLYGLNLRNALDYLKHSTKKKGYRKLPGENGTDTGEPRRGSNFGNRKYFSKREKLTKFEKGYVLLRNLEGMSNELDSNLEFDFDEINDKTELSVSNPNINKIIGILTVFKFFKPFFEKSFNAMKVQEQIYEKIGEINSQINCMETLYRSQG